MGAGTFWDKGYSGQDVWNITYELEYQPADIISITTGVSYSLNSYEAEDTDVWYYYTSVKVNF